MANFVRKLFCLCLLPFNFLFSQNLTNFEIVDSLINSIVDEISSQFNSEKIKVESNLQDKLIENRILNSLLKRFVVFFDDDVDDVVRLDAFQSKIYYIVEQTGFLKRSRLKREIEISLYCSVIKSGRLIWSDSLRRKFSDYIDPDEIEKIEDKNFKFTRGELIERSSSLRKFFEGFLVVSSIGVAIYLLFVLRK